MTDLRDTVYPKTNVKITRGLRVESGKKRAVKREWGAEGDDSEQHLQGARSHLFEPTIPTREMGKRNSRFHVPRSHTKHKDPDCPSTSGRVQSRGHRVCSLSNQVRLRHTRCA